MDTRISSEVMTAVDKAYASAPEEMCFWSWEQGVLEPGKEPGEERTVSIFLGPDKLAKALFVNPPLDYKQLPVDEWKARCAPAVAEKLGDLIGKTLFVEEKGSGYEIVEHVAEPVRLFGRPVKLFKKVKPEKVAEYAACGPQMTNRMPAEHQIILSRDNYLGKEQVYAMTELLNNL